jgi:hypothetical protein
VAAAVALRVISHRRRLRLTGEPHQSRRGIRMRVRTTYAHDPGGFAVGRSNRSIKSANGMDSTHTHWEIRYLTELAEHGSLAAGRELIQRAIDQWGRASSERPDLLEPALHNWLTRFLCSAAENPRQSIGDLMAPPREAHQRPISHAELILALSLNQEAYYRVQKAVDEGAPLATVCDAVAGELNALGYRNANNAPLRASAIRRRYYEVRRTRRRHPRPMPA